MIEIKFQECSRYAEAIKKLTQYDYGQQILISGIPLMGQIEVHFAQRGSDVAYRTEARIEGEQLIAQIPNDMLEENRDIYAYIYIISSNSGRTEYTVRLTVTARARPENFEPDIPPDPGGDDCDDEAISNEEIDELFM